MILVFWVRAIPFHGFIVASQSVYLSVLYSGFITKFGSDIKICEEHLTVRGAAHALLMVHECDARMFNSNL